MSNNFKHKLSRMDCYHCSTIEDEIITKHRRQFFLLSSILWFAVMLTLFMFIYQSAKEIRLLKNEIKHLKNSIAELEKFIDLVDNDLLSNFDGSPIIDDNSENNQIIETTPKIISKSDPRIRKARFVFDDYSQQIVENSSIFKSGFNQNRNSQEDEYNHETQHRHRSDNFDDRRIKYGRMRPLPTAHFSGTTAKYILGQHRNFNGNGHLRHLQRTYVDWEPKNWMKSTGMERQYPINDGIVTINESGLYFIYAQIYHLDEHDVNGFRVYRNGNTILQCTTTGHSSETTMKGNTCFTAGAEYLQQGDEISIGDLFDSRYSLFENGKSFFGLIKLGDIRIK